ncbi:MAG: HAMP domain-containing protein, partial [Planctomycetota bacterium]
MPRLTIRRKISFAFALCVSLIIVLATVVYFSTQRLSDQQRGVVKQDMPTKSLAMGLQGRVHAALSAHRGYIILGLEELKHERANTWTRIDEDTAKLTELVHNENNPELNAVMAELTQTLTDFRESQAKIVAIAHTPENLPATTHFNQVAQPLGRQIIEHLDQILEEENQLEATPERKNLVYRVAAAETHLLKVTASILDYLNSGNPETYTLFEQRLTACGQSVEKLKRETHLFTESQQQSFKHYLAVRDQFIKEAGIALTQRRAPDWNQAQFICANTVTPLAIQADQLLSQVVASAEQRVDHNSAALQDSASAMSAITLAVSAAVVALACVVAWLLSRMICPPILQAAEVARRIGNGDLTARLNVKSRDELGDLADGMNTMAEQTGQVITTVLDTTRDVASAATEIAASS